MLTLLGLLLSQSLFARVIYLQLKNGTDFKVSLTFSPTSSFKVRLDNTESANTTIVKLLWARKLIKVR